VNLDAIPPMPASWNYETPNIDIYIGNYGTAIAKVLDLFEPKIEHEPADVATVARNYVAAKRSEIEELKAHTFTGANTPANRAVLSELNQLCRTVG